MEGKGNGEEEKKSAAFPCPGRSNPNRKEQKNSKQAEAKLWRWMRHEILRGQRNSIRRRGITRPPCAAAIFNSVREKLPFDRGETLCSYNKTTKPPRVASRFNMDFRIPLRATCGLKYKLYLEKVIDILHGESFIGKVADQLTWSYETCALICSRKIHIQRFINVYNRSSIYIRTSSDGSRLILLMRRMISFM